MTFQKVFDNCVSLIHSELINTVHMYVLSASQIMYALQAIFYSLSFFLIT